MSTCIKKTAALLTAAAILSGCAGVPTPMGSPVRGGVVPTGESREISGRACGFQLLMFIPINLNGRHRQAYEKLERQAKGDFITDVQVEESWGYAFVGTSYCTALKARAIKVAK